MSDVQNKALSRVCAKRWPESGPQLAHQKKKFKNPNNLPGMAQIRATIQKHKARSLCTHHLPTSFPGSEYRLRCCAPLSLKDSQPTSRTYSISDLVICLQDQIKYLRLWLCLLTTVGKTRMIKKTAQEGTHGLIRKKKKE